MNIFERCDKECKSDRCDDHGADYCVDSHTAAEHFKPGHDFCGRMAWLSHGCEICEEYLAIWMELKDGKVPQRTCRTCKYRFELNFQNPYGDILYDEGTGELYFECDNCFVLKADNPSEDNALLNAIKAIQNKNETRQNKGGEHN